MRETVLTKELLPWEAKPYSSEDPFSFYQLGEQTEIEKIGVWKLQLRWKANLVFKRIFKQRYYGKKGTKRFTTGTIPYTLEVI